MKQINMDNSLQRIINVYLDAKNILEIVNDHDRHDTIRNNLLSAITLAQLKQLAEFITEAENAGIQMVIKREAN